MSLTSNSRLYNNLSSYAMPGETRSSRARTGSYGLSSTTRGASLDRRKTTHGLSTSITSTGSRSLYPRPLPPGPGPLDASGRRLTEFKTKTRTSPTSSSIRNGPLKPDYKSTYSSTYSDSYHGTSLKAKSPQNEHYGVSATTSSSLRKRSSSISSLSDATRDMKLNGGREDNYITPRSRDIADRTLSRASRKDCNDIDNHDSLWSTASRKTSVIENGTSSKSDIGRPPSGRRRDSNQDTLQESSSSNSLSSLNSKYYSSGKCGLRNLGNTCFMNSVLQCLSNTKPLLEYCLKEDYLLDKNTSTSSLKGQLITAYAKLMEGIWKDKDSSVSPNSFKTQIQRFAPRFMGYAQQDAQEFLRYLLEGLHEDVNRVTKKPKPVTIKDEDFPQDKDKGQEYWRVYLTYDNSHIVDIFVGQLRSTLNYHDCGHKSTTFDPFWDLSVPIPKGRSDVTLQSCINLFMKEEELDHDERPTCSKCKRKSACSKSFAVQRFPQILVIHFKRFSQGRYSQKVSTRVEFPDSLDVTEYSSEKGNTKIIYNFYAVSNHSGSVHSGHYTASCKHPYSGDWFHFNDNRVSSTSAHSTVSSEAYLVFYELSSRSSRL
ncbi:ubiquitin carboxyl-terminal hydrolase 2-like [Mytilus galloprovincialis]|uniref:ubiquitinyl hydrolase 1 n=1 Tax=Mytilus edulis TaxID=6550 RepID=A0A8S3VIS5_MYTED|nr:USP2 [Mytilus edulis]